MFDLSRNIDGAARDVQAGINAALAQLPSGMTRNPTYNKINPADAPIMILAMTSKSLSLAQVYDAASNVVAQKISQIEGVGQASINGATAPAVRVELNLTALNKYGIALNTVSIALQNANANRPKGYVEEDGKHWQIYTNDQLGLDPEPYKNLIVTWQHGAPVRLSDVANVSAGVQDVRNQGLFNGDPAVVIQVTKQPGANIVETIDHIRTLLPQLRAAIPADINVDVAIDRTNTIRASLRDVETSLVISVILVIFVVFVFLRSWRATIIPAIVVPVSLIGTFSIMYLAGFSLDNLSLMALTIATGFVVDDAVVVLENISRHMEEGMPRRQAVLLGAREVGFTVLSMSLSLIAVFIPILLWGGLQGRYLREFSITLSVSVLVSLTISLATTPMLCARFLRHRPADTARKTRSARLFDFSERAFAWLARFLRTDARSCAGASAADDVHPARNGVLQCLPVRHHPERILPDGRHRFHGRRRASRSEHFVSADVAEDARIHEDREGRPGRR